MEKDEKDRYAEYVRSVRERLGMYRDEFGEALGGLSAETIRHVESGHQNLGKAAQAAVEKLAAGEVREGPPLYAQLDEKAKTAGMTAEEIAELLVDESLEAQAAEIARVLGCDLRRAYTIVIRERVDNQ